MSLRRKLLILSGAYSVILLFFFFSFTSLVSRQKKTYIGDVKERKYIDELYQRRDLLKTMALEKDYEKYKNLENSWNRNNRDREIYNIFGKKRDYLIEKEEAIIDLNHKILFLQNEFKEVYLIEKEIRHSIGEYIIPLKDYEKFLIYSNMTYKSKEAMFQYKDEPHIDGWREEIEKLNYAIENTEVKKELDYYEVISEDIKRILMEEAEVEYSIERVFYEYNGELMKLDDDISERIGDWEDRIKETANTIMLRLFFLIVVLFLFSIITYKMIYPKKFEK